MVIDLNKYDFAKYKRAFINGSDNVVLVGHDNKKNTIIVGDISLADDVLTMVKDHIENNRV